LPLSGNADAVTAYTNIDATVTGVLALSGVAVTSVAITAQATGSIALDGVSQGTVALASQASGTMALGGVAMAQIGEIIIAIVLSNVTGSSGRSTLYGASPTSELSSGGGNAIIMGSSEYGDIG